MTGAEKSRSSEGRGALSPRGSPVKRKVCSACVKSSTRVVPRWVASPARSPSRCSGRSAPSAPIRPTANGMWNGCFSGVSARVSMPTLGQRWVSVSASVPAAPSHAVFTLTTGVPAWLYQSPNWVRSRPLASAIAARKSSQATAWPSWRWKYRSMPLRKPSRPSRVWYIRTTSAPFS
ncbi:hypothetical protein D3C85_1228780 [compost metagenome]